MGKVLLLFLFGVAPGVAAWWTGRGLLRHRDDPALAELMMARQQRVGLVVAVSVAFLLVAGGRQAVWAVPSSVLLLLAGRWPLRRSLLGETAGLGTYLWRCVESIVGGWGFWLLLSWTPMIVLIDSRLWPITVVLLPILLVWEHGWARIWLRLNHAVPVTDESLLARFARIVEHAGIAAPDLYLVGAPGIRFVNALAVPAIPRPAIALGNALPDLLEADEVAAIYAHELCHIEQFSPRILRRLKAINRVLIVVAVVVPVLVRVRYPEMPIEWPFLLFPAVVLAELVRRTRKSQQRETESDARAATLCGDAEVVIRALTKLHLHAYLPRRLPADFEQRATHPSLARRIQALRAIGGANSRAEPGSTVLETARDGSYVAFDDDRAWWFDGVPADTPSDLVSFRAHAASIRSVTWPELVELRVATKGVERSLRARSRNGDSWSVPLSSVQVAAVQRALDGVDVRLSRDLGRRATPFTAIIALASLLALLLAGQYGIVLLPVLLVLFRPSRAALAALGAMALARAFVALVLGEGSPLATYPVSGLAAVAGMGLIALAAAWYDTKHARGRDGLKLTLALLGSAAAVTVVLVGAVAIRVHDVAIERTLLATMGVTLLGIGGACFTGPSRRVRRFGSITALAGVLSVIPAIAGARSAEGGIELSPVSGRASEIARIPLSESGMRVDLSEDGNRFIVQQIGPRSAMSPYSRTFSYTVGTSDGHRRTIPARQVEFVDDTRVLVFVPADSGVDLRLEFVDSAVAEWIIRLPVLPVTARLVSSPRDRTWAVIGDDVRSDSLLVLSGSTSSRFRMHRFAPLDSVNALDYLVLDDGERLFLPVYDPMGYGGDSPFPLMLVPGLMQPRMEMWQLDRTGYRSLGRFNGNLDCAQPASGRILCLSRERSRSRVWSVDRQGNAVAVEPALSAFSLVGLGPGPRLSVSDGAGRVSIYDIESGRITTLSLSDDEGSVYASAAAAQTLAVLRNVAEGTQLVFFRIES